jgi:hypothetical protein
MTDFPQLGRTGTGELFATTIVHCHCAATHNSCPRLTPPTSLTVSPSLSHEYAKAWRESGGEGRDTGREGGRERKSTRYTHKEIHAHQQQQRHGEASLSVSVSLNRHMSQVFTPLSTHTHSGAYRYADRSHRCKQMCRKGHIRYDTYHISAYQISTNQHVSTYQTCRKGLTGHPCSGDQ